MGEKSEILKKLFFKDQKPKAQGQCARNHTPFPFELECQNAGNADFADCAALFPGQDRLPSGKAMLFRPDPNLIPGGWAANLLTTDRAGLWRHSRRDIGYLSEKHSFSARRTESGGLDMHRSRQSFFLNTSTSAISYPRFRCGISSQ